MHSETLPKRRRRKEDGREGVEEIPTPTRSNFQCSILTGEARLKGHRLYDSVYMRYQNGKV